MCLEAPAQPPSFSRTVWPGASDQNSPKRMIMQGTLSYDLSYSYTALGKFFSWISFWKGLSLKQGNVPLRRTIVIFVSPSLADASGNIDEHQIGLDDSLKACRIYLCWGSMTDMMVEWVYVQVRALLTSFSPSAGSQKGCFVFHRALIHPNNWWKHARKLFSNIYESN